MIKKTITLLLLFAFSFCLFACSSTPANNSRTPAYLGTWVPTSNEFDTPVLWLGNKGKGIIIWNSSSKVWDIADITEVTYKPQNDNTIMLNYINDDDHETFKYQINGDRMLLTLENMTEAYSLKRINTDSYKDNSIIGKWQYWTTPFGGTATISNGSYTIDISHLSFNQNGTYSNGAWSDTFMLSKNKNLELWHNGSLFYSFSVMYPCPGIILLYHPNNPSQSLLYYCQA